MGAQHKMTRRIQLRRDTAANWTSVDPVLAAGEVGVDLDTLKIKVGNGTLRWSELDYLVGDAADLTGLATEDYVDQAVGAIVIPDVSNFITVEDIPTIPTDISDLTDTEGLLSSSSTTSQLENGEAVFSLSEEGRLQLPQGGTVTETVVTDNPTIVLQPAEAEAQSQALFIKGGGPVFSNTENGITVEVYDTLTYSQGDTVNMGVVTQLAQGTTLYWWVDEYSPDTKFTPDTGELTIDEFGYASFNFVVNDDTVTFRVFVADELYNAYANNLGAVSVDMNASFVDTSLHLHLTTGDLTETSIFLGTDNHNVRTKPDGGIELTSYDYDTEGTYKLTFKNRTLSIDGTLSPGDTDLFIKAGDDLYLDALGDDVIIRAEDDIRIQAGYNFSEGDYSWQYRFNNTGDIAIYNNDEGYDYGIIRAIFDSSIDLDDRGISLEAENSTYIKANSGNRVWKFGNNGTLTFPEGAGKINPAVSDGGGLQIEADVDFEIKVAQTFDAGTEEETTETAIWSFDSSGGITFPDNTVQTTAYTGAIDFASRIEYTNFDTDVEHIAELTDNDFQIRLNTQLDEEEQITWAFGVDGAVTFPDGSIQTTAWTGSVEYNSVPVEYLRLPEPDTLIVTPTPTSAGTKGQVIYSAGYVYICVATNTWVRAIAETTWE
jgi:hypothetical protein